MANVSADRNWNKYIRDNTRSATIDYPIENGVSNEPIYEQATKTSKVLGNVSTGNTVKITSKQKTGTFAKVRFGTIDGYLRATTIRKPTGSTGANAEQRTLDLTNAQINRLKDIAKIGGNEGIPVEVPGIGMFMGITSVEKVDGRIHGREPKSDFRLKNALGRTVLYISHKDGSGPKGFQQYGGVSEIAGSEDLPSLIYNHPEVQNFLNTLYQFYSQAINGNLTNQNPFDINGKMKTSGAMRLINDATLINQSVYGPSYGGAYGPDNVHLIGQGQFIFTPLMSDDEDVYFRLTFSGHMSLNGDVSDFANNASGYRAIILARAGTGRNAKTSLGDIPGVRVGIFPKAIRPNAPFI